MDHTRLRQVLIDQAAELKQIQATAKFRSDTEILKNLVSTSKLVKVVQGIRRSGKSVLCHEALKGQVTAYANFDDERLTGLIADDLQRIHAVLLELYPEATIFYLDEIQNVAGWELFINRLQRLKNNIVITGSNGKLLGDDLATHLTGRQVTLQVQPLSFFEFLVWRAPETAAKTTLSGQPATSELRAELSRQFSAYFQVGGFPEVVNGEAQGIYLRELFDKIITRDIVQRFKVRDVRILKEIALYLIQESGQLASLERIKNTFSVRSQVTVQRYVRFLEYVYLVSPLRAYSYKIKERSTAARKIYACDLGMMRALWTKPTDDLGAKLETLVYLQLQRKKAEVYYLRTERGEVDFCRVENNKPVQLIQVCFQLGEERTARREIRALIEAAEKFGVRDLLIITRDDRQEILEAGYRIRVVPAYEFLLE